MSFERKVGDITNVYADVIVNSVGVKSTIYGGVCKAIVEKSESSELKHIINGVNDIYSVGDFFVTDGYKLPSRSHILHLITPLHENDKDCKLLKECIRRILNYCRFMDWFNVAFPLLGTRANGYDEKEVENILLEMCDAYCYFYPKMNVTLVIYDKSGSHYPRGQINLNERYHDEETMTKFKKGSKIMSGAMPPSVKTYTKAYFDYDKKRDEVTLNSKATQSIKTIGDYVTKYLDLRYDIDPLYLKPTDMKKRINMYLGFGTTSSSLTKAGSDTYSDIEYKNDTDQKNFYKLIFALKMSIKEAIKFLTFFGHGFANPGIRKEDDTVCYLIEMRQYGKVEIELEFKKRGLKSLFIKQ